jgi:hypothetical protein
MEIWEMIGMNYEQISVPEMLQRSIMSIHRHRYCSVLGCQLNFLINYTNQMPEEQRNTACLIEIYLGLAGFTSDWPGFISGLAGFYSELVRFFIGLGADRVRAGIQQADISRFSL